MLRETTASVSEPVAAAIVVADWMDCAVGGTGAVHTAAPEPRSNAYTPSRACSRVAGGGTPSSGQRPAARRLSTAGPRRYIRRYTVAGRPTHLGQRLRADAAAHRLARHRRRYAPACALRSRPDLLLGRSRGCARASRHPRIERGPDFRRCARRRALPGQGPRIRLLPSAPARHLDRRRGLLRRADERGSRRVPHAARLSNRRRWAGSSSRTGATVAPRPASARGAD